MEEKTQIDARMCFWGPILLLDIFWAIYPQIPQISPLWEILGKTKTINVSWMVRDTKKITPDHDKEIEHGKPIHDVFPGLRRPLLAETDIQPLPICYKYV